MVGAQTRQSSGATLKRPVWREHFSARALPTHVSTLDSKAAQIPLLSHDFVYIGGYVNWHVSLGRGQAGRCRLEFLRSHRGYVRSSAPRICPYGALGAAPMKNGSRVSGIAEAARPARRTG